MKPYMVIIITLMVVAVGAYVLYLAISMAVTHKANSVLMPAGDEDKCRDEQGFVSYMLPPLFIFGIACIAAGIVWCLANADILPYATLFKAGAVVVLLGGFIFFYIRMTRGRERYF